MLVWPEDGHASAVDVQVVTEAGFEAAHFGAQAERIATARARVRTETKTQLEGVRDDLARAQALYLEQDYAQMDRVLAEAEARALPLLAVPSACETLWELEFRRGLAARGRADADAAQARFRLAAALVPQRRPELGYYGPDVAQAFAEAAQAERASVKTPLGFSVMPADGTRVVDCRPVDAREVEVSMGLHVLWAGAPGHRPEARIVDLSRTQTLRVVLPADGLRGVDAIAALPDVVELDVSGPSSRAVLLQAARAEADAMVWLGTDGRTWRAQLHLERGRGKVHVAGTRAEAITAAVSELDADGTLRMLSPSVQPTPAPAPTRKPLVRRWWFWAATGGVVATAVAVGLAVGLGRRASSGSGRQTITVE